jgi:hypothetical protein
MIDDRPFCPHQGMQAGVYAPDAHTSRDAIGKQTENLSRKDVLRWYPHGISGFEGTPGTDIPRYVRNTNPTALNEFGTALFSVYVHASLTNRLRFYPSSTSQCR